MNISLSRNIFIGLGETGIKAIKALRHNIRETFESEPPLFGFLGIGIEENPPEGFSGGEYFRIRPASDRSQLRAIFIEESAMAVQPLLEATLNRISSATISEGTDWQFNVLDGRVKFHLVFSLSDIVGAGLCIDMAFLIRAQFKDNVLIFAHSVFGGLSEPIGRRHAANAYATLLDLDYLMTNVNGRHPYRLELPYDSFELKAMPMDAFFLVAGGEQSYRELASELYTSTLSDVLVTANADNIRQCMIDGSMDVEDKRAWITLFRAASVQFPSGVGIESKEALLKEAVNSLSPTIALEEKGYNNAPYLYRRLVVAGPEDELLALQHEPRLNEILNHFPLLVVEYYEKPLKEILLLRIDGAYPAFQLAGWENELAYKSFDDIRPFHFDTALLNKMQSYQFSLAPNVSISEKAVALWAKGRLLGLLGEDSDLPTPQSYWDLETQIDNRETEDFEQAQASYEKVRHLSPEAFQSSFPCPEHLLDAAYYYCSKEL